MKEKYECNKLKEVVKWNNMKIFEEGEEIS